MVHGITTMIIWMKKVFANIEGESCAQPFSPLALVSDKYTTTALFVKRPLHSQHDAQGYDDLHSVRSFYSRAQQEPGA